ncbi:hypothetical protein C0V82_24375 (plasmid) [Niveispirillum cyanobacteriorum]|uniref:Uncharacterized protein n=1 Tax=Niveispirillum cyanobacteriorum TaxID=1612173 RepID=A0A2K9NLI5_9PROT|nr:hypothetical protein C0V82_24375 [Niveispirillum cyanobacteriorum]GGE48147.1 hypothetical protein GCM10011317_03150 [Niveispirillum cyanobacteriorum]
MPDHKGERELRAVYLLLVGAALGLGALAFLTFQVTDSLAPLPVAGRGAILAAFCGAAGLFSLFVWLQRKARRQRQREGK